MAARHAIPPRSVDVVTEVSVENPVIDRALTRLRDAIGRLDAQRKRDVVTADLVIGTNKVRHGLGRACHGYNITPTVASAAFAHAIDRENPRPELEVWIAVIGAAQPAAIVEVF